LLLLVCFRTEAKKMTDRVSELGPIQGVEVKIADTARVELPAQFGRDGGRDELPRRGKIV
jgi:hypothetical protein